MIGPSFHGELLAAGVGDFRFSWGDDGVFEFAPGYPDGERDKVLAVFAAHDGPLATAKAASRDEVNRNIRQAVAEAHGRSGTDQDLAFAEINMLREAITIIERRPALTPAESARLEEIKVAMKQASIALGIGSRIKTDIGNSTSVPQVLALDLSISSTSQAGR